LQCSCEKYPRVTYINDALADYLQVSQDAGRWEQYAKDNVFFLLPFEEREKFRAFLDKALKSNRPVQVNHQMFRSDGSRIHLCGWLSLIPNEDGSQDYGILYRPVDEEPEEPVQDTSYFPVLERAYHVIFQLNLETSMMSCVHGLEEFPVGSMFGVEMTLDSARSFWINNYIVPEDRIMMRNYFTQICDPEDDWNGHSALQVEFRINTSGKAFHRYLGVAVHLTATQVLLCCRDITNLTYASTQAQDSQTLYRLLDWMDYFSTQEDSHTGMMLEETNEGCYLLYACPAMSEYLGLSEEERQHGTAPLPLQKCLAAANLTQADFDRLVTKKQLTVANKNDPEAAPLQISCNTYRQEGRTLYLIRCYAQREPDAEERDQAIYARTFGHFDLFLNGTPITFSNNKEKELMALLIDRNGGTLSTSEAMSYLWEDEAPDERLSARYRKLAMGLKRTLEKYGIGEILINHNGVRSVDVSALRCDYYEYLAGNPKYRQAFHNVYMSDYSWGEETLATLWDESAAI
jgi:hypothetical protein